MTRGIDAAQPLVSIVMPAYNAAATIRQSIESVFAQTYPNWELLVVDDSSSDGTAEIVLGYIEDRRVHLIRGPGRAGAAGARNVALSHATGDLVAFLDSDDVWLPEKLDRQLRFMRETRAGLVFSAYWRMDGSGERLLSKVKVPVDVDYDRLLRSNCIGCLTAMYDRRLFPSQRMPDVASHARESWLCRQLGGRIGHEDYAFWLSLLKSELGREPEFALGMSEPLARYRISASSLSGNKARAAAFQWLVYRHVERLNWARAAWNFLHYAWHGLRKS